MPIENGVGYGDHTADKQNDFKSLLSLHIDIVDGITSKAGKQWQREYTYIDMNAGPGIYNGHIGSPIAFLDKIEKTDIAYSAHFIEMVKSNADTLQDIVRCRDLHGATKVINDDHVNAMKSLSLLKATYGMVYHDPSGSIPDFDLLSEVSKRSQFRYMDFMVYLSATNIKRVRRFEQATGADAKAKLLTDYLQSVNKKTWIIRKPNGKHQWTFVIGSDWKDFPAWKSRGFYRVDSDEGQSILKFLTYTASELNSMSGQMSLDCIQTEMKQTSFFSLPAPKMESIATTKSI